MSRYRDLSIKKLQRQAIRDLRASKHDSAIEITTEIIERQADHAGAHAVQFSSLFKSKRLEQARRMGTMAARLNPTSVFILNNQACLQLEAKQPAAAAGLLKSLIDQYGEKGQWLYNLALAQRMVGNFDYAIVTFRRTLDFHELHDRAAFQLADCLSLVGQQEEAVQAYNYVRILRNGHAQSHSNFIHHAVSNDAITPTDLELEMALWADQYIPKDKRYEILPIGNTNRLKLGFLLGRLPKSWLGKIVAPLINALHARGDEVTVYWHDEVFDNGLFDESLNVVQSAGFTDADVVRQIRNASTDILIDICGMRLGSRQRALGLQIASRQFGWLAHEGQYATPSVSMVEDQLSKQTYASPIDNRRNRQLLSKNTFAGIGCQQGISQKVLKAWAELLSRQTDWSLNLDCNNQLIVRSIKRRFNELGINASRLSFNANMALTGNSIALDNFVQNDPALVIEAIQQGATVVALKGNLFPAQHTQRILEQCQGLDWLNDSVADYISQAMALSQDEARSGLSSDAFNASELGDFDAFVDRFRDVILA